MLRRLNYIEMYAHVCVCACVILYELGQLR
jgi:hypothetical protein